MDKDLQSEELPPARTDSELVAHLENRNRVLFRNLKLGLIALLVIGLVSAYNLWQISTEKQEVVTNSKIQAETTTNSDFCKIYPDTDICIISRKILENPTEPVDQPIPGKDGRGVTNFEDQNGTLVVHYTDGTSQNVGRFVGKDGTPGATGKAGTNGTNGTNGKDGIPGTNGADGRGIISTNIVSGSLIVTFTDGSTQDLGIVVGPKGEKGDPGEKGEAGEDGLTPVGFSNDLEGNVTLTYNDGSTAVVGKLTLPAVEIFQCDPDTDTLTLKLTNGPAFNATVDCSPDNLPLPPTANQ